MATSSMESELESFKSQVLQSELSSSLSLLSQLRSRRKELSNEKQRLAFEHYPVFIATAETCTKAAEGLEHQRQQVSKLADNTVPQLMSTLEHFKNLETEFSRGRKMASLVLAKHGKLLEILELPQLMQTCLRSDHYEEALAIAQMVARINKNIAIKADAMLEQRQSYVDSQDEVPEHSRESSLQLMASLHQETQRSLKTMVADLLAKLRAPLSLVESLRLLGLLRRTQMLDETQLRLSFLQAKSSHFAALMSKTTDITSTSASSRLVEAARQSLFECVSQYRALFADDDLTPNRHLLSMWLHTRLILLRQHLSEQTKSVEMEDDALETLLEQLLYFGQSLGRAGFDCRTFFVPIMSEVIEHQVMRPLKDAKQHWIQSLRAERLFRLPPQRSNQVKADDEEERRKNFENDVMRFHSLAEMANRVISALNAYRTFPLVSLKPLLASNLSNFLELMQSSLNDNLSIGRDAKERNFFTAMEKCFETSFLPLIKIYWDGTFGLSRIEDEIGIDIIALSSQLYSYQQPTQQVVSCDDMVQEKSAPQVIKVDDANEQQQSEAQGELIDQ